MEKELLNQFKEIAKKEGYVLLPKSYYERLFNSFAQLQTDLKNARKSRDKAKAEVKSLKTSYLSQQDRKDKNVLLEEDRK